MATDFRYERVEFDPTKGQVQVEPGHVTFKSPVRKAALAINGFKIKYSDKDHHVLEERINIRWRKQEIKGTTVAFEVGFLLRDSSGHIDDRFEGWVDVLVIAEVD